MSGKFQSLTLTLPEVLPFFWIMALALCHQGSAGGAAAAQGIGTQNCEHYSPCRYQTTVMVLTSLEVPVSIQI